MRVASRDGTQLLVEKSGEGSPLVLVHGVSTDHTRWAPVMKALSAEHTVFAYDRRGRGGSGDGEEYALEREIEDVLAVCDAAGDDVALLGHSFGGLLVLEAAVRARNVTKLIVYEPWIIGFRVLKPGMSAKLQAQLDARDPEGMLTTFFRDIVRATAEEFEAIRSAPSWAERVALAPTVMRELRALESYRFDGKPLRAMRVPTLLLLGERSIPAAGRMVWVAHEAVPRSRIVNLPGQGHFAINFAPQLFSDEVLKFLRG